MGLTDDIFDYKDPQTHTLFSNKHVFLHDDRVISVWAERCRREEWYKGKHPAHTLGRTLQEPYSLHLGDVEKKALCSPTLSKSTQLGKDTLQPRYDGAHITGTDVAHNIGLSAPGKEPTLKQKGDRLIPHYIHGSTRQLVSPSYSECERIRQNVKAGRSTPQSTVGVNGERVPIRVATPRSISRSSPHPNIRELKSSERVPDKHGAGGSIGGFWQADSLDTPILPEDCVQLNHGECSVARKVSNRESSFNPRQVSQAELRKHKSATNWGCRKPTPSPTPPATPRPQSCGYGHYAPATSGYISAKPRKFAKKGRPETSFRSVYCHFSGNSREEKAPPLEVKSKPFTAFSDVCVAKMSAASGSQEQVKDRESNVESDPQRNGTRPGIKVRKVKQRIQLGRNDSPLTDDTFIEQIPQQPHSTAPQLKEHTTTPRPQSSTQELNRTSSREPTSREIASASPRRRPISVGKLMWKHATTQARYNLSRSTPRPSTSMEGLLTYRRTEKGRNEALPRRCSTRCGVQSSTPLAPRPASARHDQLTSRLG